MKDTEPFRAVTNDSQRAMFKGLEETNPDTNYYKYLEVLIDTWHETGANKVKDSQNYKLMTICHHDPWFNNIMFKYQKGEN